LNKSLFHVLMASRNGAGHGDKIRCLQNAQAILLCGLATPTYTDLRRQPNLLSARIHFHPKWCRIRHVFLL